MLRHRVPFIATAMLGLAIAACSGSSATPTPAAAATSPSASPSAPASESPAMPSLALPSGSLALPGFSLPSSDKELEALLPSSVDGVTLQKLSFAGADIASGTPNSKQFTGFLQQLGKSPSDVGLAIAADSTGTLGISIVALQVKGADQAQLLQQFAAASQASAANVATTTVTIGGKSVLKIVDPTNTAGAEYIYVKNDVLYLVQGKDDKTIGDAIAALP